MSDWMDYRGFKIQIKETRETTEERLARGDYRLQIKGYYFHIWELASQGFKRIKDESEDYPSFDAAADNAQGTVDAIVDSLE